MKCMQINFRGRGLSNFGDFAHFLFAGQNGQIFPSNHGQSMGVKK